MSQSPTGSSAGAGAGGLPDEEDIEVGFRAMTIERSEPVQHVTCQFSVYPLGVPDLAPSVDEALAAVRHHGLEVTPGAMSSTVVGPTDEVFAALGDAFEAVAATGCVLVATVSNACPT